MSLWATHLISTFWLPLWLSENQALDFSQLLAASNLAKRRRSQKKKSFSEYPEVPANMVGPSFTPSKSKGKQLAISSEESDVDWSPGLKDILVEPEGVYWHTWTHTGTIAPVDYSLWVRELKSMMNTPLSLNPNHLILLQRQPPSLAWRELPRKWPGNSKSGPEF